MNGHDLCLLSRLYGFCFQRSVCPYAYILLRHRNPERRMGADHDAPAGRLGQADIERVQIKEWMQGTAIVEKSVNSKVHVILAEIWGQMKINGYVFKPQKRENTSALYVQG